MTDAEGGTFGTSVTCMDGRIQEPLRRWIIEKFGVEHVDTITQPGIDGVLAGSTTLGDVGLAEKMTSISVKAHGSCIVVVSGHHDCAGNPVDEKQHRANIRSAINTIKSWNGMADIRIEGVWVNHNWQVEPVPL